MTGALHQLKLDYAAAEDRLMLRISTHDRTEVRLWFTRRFTKALWDNLVKIAESSSSALHAIDAETRETVIALQHEKAVDDDQFGHDFEETATDFPLGQSPSLVVGLAIRGGEPGEPPRLAFETAERKLISLGLDDQILHSMMRLIAQSMKQTDWDLALEIAAPAATAAEPDRPVQLH
jgi:hypothetical protein